MKFISWNVNGLRAALNKGFNDIFSDIDADFFCLQETKLQEGQTDFAPDGYSSYWNYAEKKGYSGVAIFSRHTPLSVTKGIGIPGHDNEGRVLTLEFAQFYLVTVYTPNSQ
ncbi:MAG TPA: exodeoxyribonuclease III, partial [Muribaculaceae bacterium]|nr:exodeoxyribonuclease III [Muribaculaceae bacterium]